EVVASHDARRHLRRRLSLVCEHAGLDEDRTRAWTLVREVAQARWAAHYGDHAGLTTAVTVIKAMAD
ncbi:MAG: aminoglycoside phosphotransferase family protein, partial [Oryzihumus sp.]